MPNPKFHALLKQMAEMHDKKSADYATDTNYYSNFEQAAVSAGTTVDAVFRTMVGIKMARLAELQGKGKTPKNESVMDSLLDLAVYGALYASYYLQLETDKKTVPTAQDIMTSLQREALRQEIANQRPPMGEHDQD